MAGMIFSSLAFSAFNAAFNWVFSVVSWLMICVCSASLACASLSSQPLKKVVATKMAATKMFFFILSSFIDNVLLILPKHEYVQGLHSTLEYSDNFRHPHL